VEESPDRSTHRLLVWAGRVRVGVGCFSQVGPALRPVVDIFEVEARLIQEVTEPDVRPIVAQRSQFGDLGWPARRDRIT